MKTTIEIRDDLLKAAKKEAIDRGVPLRALVEAALEREVSVEQDEAHAAGRRRELSSRLEAARLRFEKKVAAERLPVESMDEARLGLLPLPVFHDGEPDLSLRVSEVLAEALRQRE